MQQGPSEIGKFFEVLSPSERENFARVTTEMTEDCFQARIEKLDGEIKKLDNEIQQANRRRSVLSGSLSRAEELLKKLDMFTRENGSVQLLMFKNIVYNLVADLRKEIAVMKPDFRLKKKFDLSRLKASLIQRRAIAEKIQEELRRYGS